jgi:Zn-dependent M16 (insulinase) family peptidase
MKNPQLFRGDRFGTVIKLTAIIMLSTIISSGCQREPNLHGFRLVEKRFVREVNADCYYLEHIRSGARVLKIANDDPNKTFSIAFKTVPESDNGAPHILEHAVLNGSKNFPVKSPFDVLSKGSLNTFINAFTSKDFTMYPVASMNEKDYYNLMHVYLDAVFNPLIYREPKILKQEGWHYEMAEADGPVEYRGVVYNEMKGAFSNPTRELWYQVFKNLFPSSPYGFESGGYPTAIPGLDQEQFIRFHKKYYHPENSYIFLYGDSDLEKELAFIDSAYLSGYTRDENRVTIEDQAPFTSMKEVTGWYPVLEGSDTEGQTYLTLNWVAGHNTDQALNMSLDILAEVLVNQESAPVRLALQKAGIGQDVSASVSNFKQNVVQIFVQNANSGDRGRFLETVRSTLKEVAARGLDKKEVEGVINRKEFQLREGNDAQKGLTWINQTLGPWFFSGDPFVGLEYEKPLAEVKKALTTDYLEKVMVQYLIENPHCLLLALEPRPGLDKERSEATERSLQEFKKSLTKEQVAGLVGETRELIEYQKREDTPEALATIPMLGLSDIDPKARFYEVEEQRERGVPILFHEEFTNGVVYTNFYFDLRVLPREMIPYASLLSNFIGLLNTGDHTFGEINQLLNIHTGGFYTSLKTYTEEMDDSRLLPKFTVTSKSMNNKLDKLAELASEILGKTIYRDTARVKILLTRLQSQLDAEMKGNGYAVASRRLSSYISRQGLFTELTRGMEFYWFVSELTKNYENRKEEICRNLQKTAEMLFAKSNLVVSVTCGREDFERFRNHFPTLEKSLSGTAPALNEWNLKPENLREGILAPSKVQYVIEGSDFKKLGYPWNAKMRVLSQILSTDWLQSRIRVIGGAYGGWSSFSMTGSVTFNSYRDPNLKETLRNYEGTTEYLSGFRADQKTMTRYIIGTIASMDSPLTASDKGDLAVTYYFNKRRPEAIQSDRTAVLETTAEDIQRFAPLVKGILDQRTYCVYGNSDKISQDKGLFMSLVKIER